MNIEMTVRVPAQDAILIAPAGLTSPAATCTGVQVHGAGCFGHDVAPCGQTLLELHPSADTVTLVYSFDATPGDLPDAIWADRDSRFTRAAPELAREAQQIVAADGVEGYVTHVAQIFHYGHTDTKFYDGTDEMPQLCDMTTGSCVDINAYLIAGLRAAGIDAGYLTGYFIPAERRDHTTDMHCWVVTRYLGQIQHWDIAHHLKLGTRRILPGLNPKPGVRVAISHSMGWTLPALGLQDAKLLCEPVWRTAEGYGDSNATFQLVGFDALNAAQNTPVVA
ncbi:MAG: transglutaminase family protein [Pseudomonadota bacterium]